MKTKAGDSEFNKKVGLIVRNRRVFLGKSQTEVAEKLGVSFQQQQKYEKGINGLTLERAVDVCNELGLTLGELAQSEGAIIKALPQALAKNLNKLSDEQLKSVGDLVRSLAKQNEA